VRPFEDTGPRGVLELFSLFRKRLREKSEMMRMSSFFWVSLRVE
jgi:hypothetical protein